MAAALTLLMALFVFTPLAGLYIFGVQDMTQPVGNLALSTLPLFLLFPALAVFISWLRGLLIKQRVTREVNVGMAINLVITAVVLALGLVWQYPGLPTAAVALNVAALAEVVYLLWRSQRVLTLGLPLLRPWQPEPGTP